MANENAIDDIIVDNTTPEVEEQNNEDIEKAVTEAAEDEVVDDEKINDVEDTTDNEETPEPVDEAEPQADEAADETADDNDIESAEPETVTAEPPVEEKIVPVEGAIELIERIPLYANATAIKPLGYIKGLVFIVDGVVSMGRVRVANDANLTNIIGWCNKEQI